MPRTSKMKIRISLLQRNFVKYQDFQPASSTEYVVVSNFRQSLKNYVSILEQYRFDVTDLIRNANNKIKAIEAAQYYNM